MSACPIWISVTPLSQGNDDSAAHVSQIYVMSSFINELAEAAEGEEYVEIQI